MSWWIKSVVITLLTIPRRSFFCGSFLLFVFHVYLSHTLFSVPCSLVATCCERADLLVILFVMFACAFVTLPFGVLVYLLQQDRYESLLLPETSDNHQRPKANVNIVFKGR